MAKKKTFAELMAEAALQGMPEDKTTADLLNVPLSRGAILPLTEYLDRAEFDLSSGLPGAFADAVTAPARAARGEISEAEQIPEAFNFAGSLTLGSLLAPRPTGSVGMGGRAAKEALDMSEAARMARAKEMGFDTPFYHITQNQFDEFKPGVRGASFFAGTEADAARGASAGQREWTMNFATEPSRAPSRTISALGKSSTIEGLALSPSQKKLFEAMPDKMSLDDYQNVWRKKIEDEFGTVPPWLYDEGTVSMPDGRVFSYDDLSKLTDAELDDVRTFGKETLSKGQVPAFSYEDARRTGRDIFGRQIAHWGPTSDEAAIAKRVSDNGMGGYLINDEAGVSVAVTDPRNIRSVNAAFDPEKAHLANLLAANAKTGAAVPLATKALEAQQPQGIRAFQGSPHNYKAERLIEWPDGRTEYIEGMPDVLPDIPEGAKVLKDFPLGRVRLDKVGTGEGAQAYGYGAYAAEAEDVARSYRDALSAGQAETPEQLAKSWFGEVGDRAAAADEIRRSARRFKNTKIAQKYEEAARILESDLDLNAIPDPGHMYEVNIKADPQDFLDWDKPLSQQSEKVRGALTAEAMGLKPNTITNSAGQQFSGWVDADGKLVGQGIKGAEPPANFIPDHVLNDPNVTPQNLVKSYLAGDDRARASKYLREAGIPGIRYLDQMSRGAGEGSSNYVVFDDAIIDIVRKYGIAGLALLQAAGYGTNEGEETQ